MLARKWQWCDLKEHFINERMCKRFKRPKCKKKLRCGRYEKWEEEVKQIGFRPRAAQEGRRVRERVVEE